MKRASLLLLVAVVFHVCGIVSGHGKLIYPSPRANSGSTSSRGDKILGTPTAAQLNSCGGADNKDPGPLASVGTFQAGTKLTVVWRTTVSHANAPGVRIAIAYDGNNKFSDNILINNIDVGGVEGTGCHNYTVTLPAGKTGTKAVLQWMWASSDDGGFYMGCAGILSRFSTSFPPSYALLPSYLLSFSKNPPLYFLRVRIERNEDIVVQSGVVSTDNSNHTLYNAQCVASGAITTVSVSAAASIGGNSAGTTVGYTDSSATALIAGSFALLLVSFALIL